jgi:chromosome partitioning protein
MKSPRVITILNLKGGVGKTHTTWLIASVCQERAKRVLLIDTDTQGNLSNSFLDPADHQPGVEMLFHPGSDTSIQRLIRATAFSHIDLIPSGPALAPLDFSNQKEWEKADLHFSLVEAIKPLNDQYDYIVFDCPPRLSLVSFAALCASDAVIIPMEAADWGAQGIMQVTAAIEHVEKRYNEDLRLLGYVVSRFKKARAYQQSYLRQLRAHFGLKAFDTVLPDLAAFEKSVTDRIPITLHARRSVAAGIARQFFDEVERRAQGVKSFRRRRCGQSIQPLARAAG